MIRLLISSRSRASAAVIEAADLIIAAKPTAEQARKAVKAKLTALIMLGQWGDHDAAAKHLEAMPAELEKAGLADLVPMVRRARLQQRVRQLATLGKEDGLKLLDEYKEKCREPDRLQRARNWRRAPRVVPRIWQQ